MLLRSCVFSAANTSSECVEVGPGFPFEVTAYWFAGGTVDELPEVRGRGTPLLRPSVVNPRWLMGIPWNSLFLIGCWGRNKATRNITLLGKLDHLEISSQVGRGYTRQNWEVIHRRCPKAATDEPHSIIQDDFNLVGLGTVAPNRCNVFSSRVCQSNSGCVQSVEGCTPTSSC